MAGRKTLGSGRFLLFPLCLVIIGVLAACGTGASLSASDLQTCADTVAKVRQQVTWAVQPYQLNYYPFWATPGDAQIISPFNGTVWEFGQQIDIEVKQPALDPGVQEHSIHIYVMPIDSVSFNDMVWGGPIKPFGFLYMPWPKQPEFTRQWMPNKSGKFVIIVLYRNFKIGGDPFGGPPYNYGPASVGYSCIRILPIKAGVNVVEPIIQPAIQEFPTREASPTNTSSPTFTSSPTGTPTPTLTLTPTFTKTILVLPTRISPTWTFTPKPPTQTLVPSCSGLSERECALNSSCKWTIPPTGGPGYCEAK